MEENSRENTVFVSLFGKYEFVRMPFGLKNAPAVFQHLMEKTLKGCREFAAAYIDDVLIFSKTWDEHLIHVKKVLQALRKAGLTAKPSKCKWRRSSIHYLGHTIGSGQVSVPEDRVKSMSEYRTPVSKCDLVYFWNRRILLQVYQEFLQLFNYPRTCYF